MADENAASRFPDDRGRFGDFGGKFIPETLMAAVSELEDAYQTAKADPEFQERLGHLLGHEFEPHIGVWDAGGWQPRELCGERGKRCYVMFEPHTSTW